MKRLFTTLLLFSAITISAQTVIKVSNCAGDATSKIRSAIESARKMNGKPVIIELENATYNISRDSSSKIIYHISNSTSETENSDQTKHIGILIKGIQNLTINGNGATFMTHGEVTTFIVDSCENIVLRNFNINSADPTVPEFTVDKVVENGMIVSINPQSKYEIDKNGKFSFYGDSWRLSNGIAQTYDIKRDITWRSWSPLNEIKKAVELSPGKVMLVYDKIPKVEEGSVFQMRDGVRDEVCGLIHGSKNTVIEGVNFYFLGNFGIVAQVSENITYRNLNFAPEPSSGRTCAGFADFVQVSGCKGKVIIENSRFSGAHDDPINIHGTHLKVTEVIATDKIVVKYMHHQTYGFQSFYSGNKVDFIDENSLMPAYENAEVKSAYMRTPREIVITFTKPLPLAVIENKSLVAENVTYTPEVYITGNYFSRIPSRGVLVTTRRKIVIENNTFFRMQMNGILIADDARSWFESGMTRDITIKDNDFIECGAPVIFIMPESNKNEGFVHKNINIVNNRFILNSDNAIFAKSVEGLNITNNLFRTNSVTTPLSLIKTENCKDVTVKNNIIEK